jgi:hypothetical protein
MRTVFLTTYALTLSALVICTVVMAVRTAYPGEERPSLTSGLREYTEFQQRLDEFETREDNRQRVYAGAYGMAGLVLMAVGLFALSSIFNAVRCGLLAGGTILVLAASLDASSGDADWLGLVVSIIGLFVLAVGLCYLEEGYFKRNRSDSDKPLTGT